MKMTSAETSLQVVLSPQDSRHPVRHENLQSALERRLAKTGGIGFDELCMGSVYGIIHHIHAP